jgi:hypothetical protein
MLRREIVTVINISLFVIGTESNFRAGWTWLNA